MITQLLSTNSGLDDIKLQDLEKQYPWCSLVQFRLVKYYKDKTSDKLSPVAKKAALFFPDVLRVKEQLGLMDAPVKNNISEIKEVPVITPEVTPSNLKPVEKEEPLFEPLHTVDYFASQGIKVTEEAMTTDKLGKQLKSFTEWLKTMKKIPTERMPLPDATTEKKIQTIAEGSNVTEDVITEAMAEVFIKQGKPEKAIEIYEKLSLLNTSKSAYFAAKIDSLKC
jgi:hypothetical protein